VVDHSRFKEYTREIHANLPEIDENDEIEKPFNAKELKPPLQDYKVPSPHHSIPRLDENKIQDHAIAEGEGTDSMSVMSPASYTIPQYKFSDAQKNNVYKIMSQLPGVPQFLNS